ncbi:MAG: hypothetical protein LBC21_02020 [Oscillospiraceae bacterium]|jgi:hypothetical protein|nr:hypothetical protein [Oscillospiraceae bacterium]
MPMLPMLPRGSGLRKLTQVSFGGYNHNLYAGDGDIYDMHNMTGDYAPVLSPRSPRVLRAELARPNGIFSRDGLMYADGTDLYYGGELVGEVADSVKTFGEMGAYIVVLPDKAYYNVLTGEFGRVEASATSEDGGATFANGSIYGITAERNTLTVPGVDFNDHFKERDAVSISGCTVHPENNKTAIIREISGDGHSLIFYENAFVLDGTAEAPVAYTEPEAITVSRDMPDMDFLCSNENRLWGCKGDEIFASKLGDVFNWFSFDGLASDSWSVAVGSEGDFTGCVSFMGYPVFFKEGAIYKVFGTEPDNFSTSASFSTGLQAGSGGSLAIAGDILFYLSRNGVVSYTGGMPTQKYEAFGGELYTHGVAGSDRRKYYISMLDRNGAPHLFVYDTERGLWHREDASRVVGFAYCGEDLYMLRDDGGLWAVGNVKGQPDGGELERVEWSVEFADFSERAPEKKGVTKFYLRAEAEQGAEMEMWIRYDSVGAWERIWRHLATKKRSFTVPIVPRRADHFRLRISGAGDCKVFGITREMYTGSTARSLRGGH